MSDEPVPTKSSDRTWFKASGLLRDLATPLSVAIVGLLASVYVNSQQSTDSKQRAFAELITQREAADTNLRIEMFKTVLAGILKPGDEGLSDQILKLEILAYNFNESLDLSPLFQDVFRRINANPNNEQYRERINRVAQDVAFKQVEALTFEVGVTKDIPVIDFDELKAKPEGIPNLINETDRLRYSAEDAPNHPERRFKLDVFARDEKMKELTVRLVVSPPSQTGPDVKPEVDVRFNVGYFDFPAINNTRLSNGERVAIVVRNMDESSAKLSLVYFPASRAGLKDRMNIEEILNQRRQIK